MTALQERRKIYERLSNIIGKNIQKDDSIKITVNEYLSICFFFLEVYDATTDETRAASISSLNAVIDFLELARRITSYDAERLKAFETRITEKNITGKEQEDTP